MQYGMHCKKKSRRKFTAIEQFKLAIIKEWRNLSQRLIDRSINKWRQSLEKALRNTLNMFSDYLNTWQTTVNLKKYINLIILNNYHTKRGSHFSHPSCRLCTYRPTVTVQHRRSHEQFVGGGFMRFALG